MRHEKPEVKFERLGIKGETASVSNRKTFFFFSQFNGITKKQSWCGCNSRNRFTGTLD